MYVAINQGVPTATVHLDIPLRLITAEVHKIPPPPIRLVTDKRDSKTVEKEQRFSFRLSMGYFFLLCE